MKTFSVLSCGTPANVADAAVTFTTTTYNSVGYNFFGSSEDAVCDVTGQWTGISGSCLIVSCGDPIAIPYAAWTYTTVTYNSITSYTCNEGYHFQSAGPRFDVTCHTSGQWSSVAGDCSKIKDCGSGNVNVYCDMANNGGGWTLLQRRTDGSEDFYRYWDKYQKGFGNLFNEFWLGNTAIYRITNQRNYELRFDLEDWTGAKTYAIYSKFSIMDETQN